MKNYPTNIWQKLPMLSILFVMMLPLSCLKDGSNTLVLPSAPLSFLDRSNDNQGTYHLPDKHIEIALWDHALIDGDIISLFLNSAPLVQELTLDGSDNKYVLQATLHDGTNALVLFAHNEGTSPPNTATINVKSGTEEKELILNADLKTNALIELVID